MLTGETIATGAAATCTDCGTTPKLQVLSSRAGWYIGTQCECGQYSRESDYYRSEAVAKLALDLGNFGRG